MARSGIDLIYQQLASDDEGRVCKDIPEGACHDQPRNFLVHVVSLAASKSADGLIDPKLVLSWLLTSLGAGTVFVGLLVPVREAGALMPQLFTAGAIRAMPRRKWAWAGGAAVQGVCALGMAVSAIVLDGGAAGFAIVGLLGILALARSVCSVAYKDVLGKTVDKARRGSATGSAGSLAAALVICFALMLASGWVGKTVLIPLALCVAGGLWLFAAFSFTTLAEDSGATEGGANAIVAARENLGLLARDGQLRRFITARGLLVSTALAPPFMVALGGAGSGRAYEALGWLVLASATAGLVSSYVWGRLADHSSRLVLVFSALSSAMALAATWVGDRAGGLDAAGVLPALLFLLMIAYHGVRLGRSTHLVDMATKETRAAYTALSNTIIGVLLLAGGVFSWVGAAFGPAVVIALLAAMSALAIPVALGLDEVQSS
ncbi:MAG: MFS transporter [Alphaproteobacteria bacterium]|jgi:hypothetical protein|nr:MFS transporter [Alphaproteobacteria bacterium]